MLILAIVLFIIAAIFGLKLLIAVLKNQPTSTFAAFAHGSFVVLALLVMVSYIATGHTSTLLITSLVLFILAALGGLTLLSFDVRKRPIPKVIAVVHPLIAVAALVILIIVALQVAGILQM